MVPILGEVRFFRVVLRLWGTKKFQARPIFLIFFKSSSIMAQSRNYFDKTLMFMPNCAAKAFYSCPAIISQRPESRIISKEPQENTEEESKII
jgi:hypothetical protein